MFYFCYSQVKFFFLSARANRPKRPDRAVYVPRHRRSVSEVESKNVSSQESPAKPSVEHTPPPPMTRPVVSRNAPAPELQAKSAVETTPPPLRRPLDRHKFKKIEKMEDQAIHNEENTVPEKLVDQVISKEANNSLPQQTDKIIMCESTRIDLETQVISKQTDFVSEKMEAEEILEEALTTELVDDADQKQFSTAVGKETVVQQYSENSIEVSEDEIVEQISNKPREEKMDEDVKSDTSSDIVSSTSHTQCRSENSSTSFDEFYDKDDMQKLSNNLTETPTAVLVNDESCLGMDVSNDVKQESKTASDIPLSNAEQIEKPVKQTLVSKVLIISTCDENKPETVKSDPAPEIAPPEKKKVKKVERPKSKPAPPPPPAVPNKKINRDECDWDSLFDDNGDCLDPTLIEEVKFIFSFLFFLITLVLLRNVNI